jgi:hypothetical protein
LAEEAGFRPSRIRKKWHCGAHAPDNTASVHDYGNHFHCFTCDRSFDAIGLEQRARGGTPGDAIRRLAERYGLSSAPGRITQRPRVTTEAIAEAELFRVGLAWRIERALEVVKRHLWTEDGNSDAEDACRRLTEHLAAVRAWSPYEAARVHRLASALELARDSVAEAREAYRVLARAIAGARWAAAA